MGLAIRGTLRGSATDLRFLRDHSCSGSHKKYPLWRLLQQEQLFFVGLKSFPERVNVDVKTFALFDWRHVAPHIMLERRQVRTPCALAFPAGACGFHAELARNFGEV